MQLIHTFWHVQNKFDNRGYIYLWVENNEAIKTKGNYPFQLSSSKSETFINELFPNNDFTKKSISASFPVNAKKEPIPSPIISNINNQDDIEIKAFAKFNLNCFQIPCPVSLLKDLNFKHYYFDSNLKLAGDSLFWIQLMQKFSKLIKYDQYIPYIVPIKKKSSVSYLFKWQPMSPHFDKFISNVTDAMPYSAFLDSEYNYDKTSVIKHFSEVCLTDIISKTSYPQKLIKYFSESPLQYGIEDVGKNFKIPEETWKSWKLWKNNLEYDQFGAPFTISFRLNSAKDKNGSDWSLEILLQSKKDPSFVVNLADYWKKKDNGRELYNKMLGTSVERFLLLQLGYACRLYPLLERALSDNFKNTDLKLTTEQAFQFLKEDAWILHSCGYNVTVPSWWTPKGRLKAKIKMKAKRNSDSGGNNPVGYFDKKSTLRFDYNISVGEDQISEEEWLQLLESKSSLVHFRGKWMEINPDEMNKIHKLLESAQKDNIQGSIMDLLNMSAVDSVYDLECDSDIEEMLDNLNDKDNIILTEQPENLKGTLRPYQTRGLSWLSYLEYLGMNPCLADDMGLGKTVQVISLLLKESRKGTALLVAPTSVLGNWYREFQKFAPLLRINIHHGTNRTKPADFDKIIDASDVLVTSFGLIRRDKKLFQDHHWSRVIVDEAQNIKNPTAAITKTLCKIKSDSRIALTGTPIENRLMDLWSIFNFLNPGFLGTQSGFRKVFEFPVQRDNDIEKTKILKSMVEPFILRRLKTDKNIIADLPDKVEQKIYCQLTQEQASIYESIVEQVIEKFEDDSEETSVQEKNAIMISTLLKLKQVCNHPAQILQDGSAFDISRSVKLKRLVDMIEEIMESGSSVLVFSQFTEICSELDKLLKTKFGYNTYYIHGGTSRTKREKMISEFQDENSPPGIFVLSLKAGGVGITLTKANYVIHFDRWWNPAVENQATDRAYRIGQDKTVFVNKFITMGTIEEKIDKMLEDKQKVSDSIIGSSESWISKLDSRAFIDMIQLSKATMVEQDADS